MPGLVKVIPDLAAAIAYAEGFGASPTNKPTRLNNPGDLTQGGVILDYPHAAAGWDALFTKLRRIFAGQSTVYNSGMTIQALADKWTTTQQAAWADNVIKFLNEHGYKASTFTRLIDLC